ncbi:hypothetical protein F5Y13DRAFT_189114 [Hypoxylon sp. FL1857]|nr:hypothetical protein F5Y13DRAFT_189114 [Hypoxylon sp. FL1857]
MRSSLVKAATFALLGLSNVFLGVNGAPMSLSQTGDVKPFDGSYALADLNARGSGKGSGSGSKGSGSSSSKGSGSGGKGRSSKGGSGSSGSSTGGSGTAYAPKQVPDVFRQGGPYKAEKAYIDNGVTTWMVSSHESHIDTIETRHDAQESSITVADAINKEYDSVPKDHGRMYLSDIMMALWNKMEGRLPSELTVIRFDGVIEPDTAAAMDSAEKAMGKQEFTLKSTAKSGSAEKTAFDRIAKSVFGKLTSRILQEFSVGKRISQFEIDQGKALTVTLA